MTLKNKLYLLKNISIVFYAIGGEIIKDSKKNCYQTKKVISTLYRTYHFSGISAFVLLFIFLGIPHFFDNIMFQFLETIFYYLIIEIVIFFLIPLKNISRS